MAIHKPYDRHFVSTGAVKTEGGSLNLALGQLGVFKVNTKHNAQGLEALSNFKNLSKKEKVEDVVEKGKSKAPCGFSKNEVKDMKKLTLRILAQAVGWRDSVSRQGHTAQLKEGER